jgi:hypothetical protein
MCAFQAENGERLREQWLSRIAIGDPQTSNASIPNSLMDRKIHRLRVRRKRYDVERK